MGAIKTQYLPQYQVSDYQQWVGDWELIEGIPFAMSPSAHPEHQRFAREILMALDRALTLAKDYDCELFYELDLIVGQQTVVRPDIMLIYESLEEGKYPSSPPPLIVEVLSDSTETVDRQVKMDIYRDFGVLNYWLADPKTRKIDFLQFSEGQYREKLNFEVLQLKDCELRIDFKAFP